MSNTNSKNLIFHVLALLVSLVWGSTFVASKVLLNAGMTPAEIMTLRFILAYIIMLPFSHKYIISKSLKDELIFVSCGITAGSLYFFTENTAVKLASATSTVALVICITPILTAITNRIVYKENTLSKNFLIGSVIALLGTTLVIMNGVFVLDDNPLVILFSILASVCWAVYSLTLRKIENRYHSDVITRKIFFWGVVTMMIYFIFDPMTVTMEMILQPQSLIWLLFLAVVASLGCYLVWNIVLKRIGVVTASSYLYFNPVVSLITGYVVLNENITIWAILGCVLTILGVFLCNKKVKNTTSDLSQTA
jgi:drug/metabolite transporter (DMT)-like permease